MGKKRAKDSRTLIERCLIRNSGESMDGLMWKSAIRAELGGGCGTFQRCMARDAPCCRMASLEARGRQLIGRTGYEPAWWVAGEVKCSISTMWVAGQDTVGNALLRMPIERKPDSQ